MLQKAFVIVADIVNPGLRELNQCLETGWKVVHVCPMPSACSAKGDENHVSKILPTCLVVIEEE